MFLLLCLFSANARAESPDEPPGITLADAIERAGHAPPVTAAAAAGRAAEARVDQVQAARLPGLRVGGNVNAWNHTYEIVFPLPGAPPEPFPVRNWLTAGLQVSTAVPLTGQLALTDRIDAARSEVDAARDGEALAVTDAHYQAEDVWFGALQADRQLDIALAQVSRLESRVQTANVAFQGGTVTRNDVLQAELALAVARQAVIQVRTARDAARARLGLVVGNGGSPLRPIDEPDAPPPPPPPVEVLVDRALVTRPELLALRARVEGADAGARALGRERLPNVAAVGAYLHTEGQGPFAEKDSAYVGATLDWPVWSWGAKSAAQDGARAGADALRAQLEQVESVVRVEVRTRADALAAALAAYEVAARSVGQAEENLRIHDTMRAAGAGTMSDLLDAEASLVEARSRTAAALYDAHRAKAALWRAVGADPTGVDG